MYNEVKFFTMKILSYIFDISFHYNLRGQFVCVIKEHLTISNYPGWEGKIKVCLM